jgi:hypothetical protein
MRKFVGLFFAIASVQPVVAAERPGAAVPLSIDGRGGIIVHVLVNDTGPYRFILDTGTSRSIVSDRLARELDAPLVAKSEVVTNAGSEVHVVARLAAIAIASTRVANVLSPVLPEARLGLLGAGVRGVLGQDFLSAFNYTLDYRRSLLTWDEPLTCGTRGTVRLNAAEGRFVMAVEDRSGATLRLVPDSGAEMPVLFRAERPRAMTSPMKDLRVGEVTLKRLDAYNVQRIDPNADGLLPLHQFATVSFAAGGACLWARK